MPLMHATQFDLRLPHPWVRGQSYRLNSFRHKGYWFHGRRREMRTMELFGRLLGAGSQVVEVGGHIGFVSMYLSSIVGNSGRVVVFEPGSNNLPYLRANTARLGNVEVVEAACSDADGSALLFEESLTGQNNSLLRDFPGLSENQRLAYVQVKTSERLIRTVRLDNHLAGQPVDLMKIDIEGHEYFALQGARALLSRCKPSIMVEVQADQAEVFEFLKSLGYKMFDDRLLEIPDAGSLNGNVFALQESNELAGRLLANRAG